MAHTSCAARSASTGAPTTARSHPPNAAPASAVTATDAADRSDTGATVTDDPVTWLRAQLDEDERLAQEAADGDGGTWYMGERWNVFRDEDVAPEGCGDVHRLVVYGNVRSQSEHIARHDPARVLAEVAAKRAILDLHDPNDTTGKRRWCVGCIEPDLPGLMVRMPCQHARLLAAPYADRPGYRNEWAPHAPTQSEAAMNGDR
jgi:hypothetical protein